MLNIPNIPSSKVEMNYDYAGGHGWTSMKLYSQFIADMPPVLGRVDRDPVGIVAPQPLGTFYLHARLQFIIALLLVCWTNTATLPFCASIVFLCNRAPPFFLLFDQSIHFSSVLDLPDLHRISCPHRRKV